MNELTKAIWIEAAFTGARCYDMSTDSIRPVADFISRDYFATVYDLGFPSCPELSVDLESRAWIWRHARSVNLTMADVIARASN